MATRKEVEITAALVQRTLSGLIELNVPFALVIGDGLKIFTNPDLSKRHAVSILRDALEYEDRCYEALLTKKVEDDTGTERE